MYYLLWTTLAFTIYNKILSMCFASLTVPSTCKIYEHVEVFMSKKYSGRQIEIDNESRVNIARNTTTWVYHNGRLFAIHNSVDNNSDKGICGVRKCYIIRSLWRESLEDFIKDVNILYGSSKTTLEIRSSCAYDWKIQSYPIRKISSIVDSAPIKEMLADARKFISQKNRYLELGVPYRRGYLLDGPPGTGKSSCAMCLAGELNRPLCYMSLTGSHANDEWLIEMLSRAPEGSIVLFDDYDRVSLSADSCNGITMGGLLNALDGVVAQTGKIIILAVNDSSKIIDALLRPGRIDRRFTFKLTTKDEAKNLFERFHGKEYADIFYKNLQDTYSPASITTHLMKYESAKDAAINAFEIKKN